MKIVFLNGPPRSGKDTCASIIADRFAGVATMKMSDPVKAAVHAAFGLAHNVNGFETRKDQPCEEFFGFTPRQCYINHSEKYMKPLYGKDVFGKLFARRMEYIKYAQKATVIVADSGFVEESIPAIEKVGAENCMLIRIHRPGHTYENDSRSYLELNVSTIIDLQNDGTLEDLASQIHEYYQVFMNSHV